MQVHEVHDEGTTVLIMLDGVPFPFVIPSTSPTWLLTFATLAGVPASWVADRLLLVPVDMAAVFR